MIQQQNLSRIEKYLLASNKLSCMSNEQLQHLLSNGKKMHVGIGGSSIQIDINDISVFVKQIPVTELELNPKNLMSTANLLNLPMCYQYGIGSAGFGAWRELAAHVMTTNWVLTQQCAHFPLTYHWRMIPQSSDKINLTYWESADNYLDNWENNKQITERVKGLQNAPASILLFLECFPQNLYQQIKEIMSSSSEQKLITYFEQLNNSFETIFQFMHQQSLIHMDAHFHNILADENRIYLSDFGLAISSQFDLSLSEQSFMQDHKNYDRCSYPPNLFHSILTTYVGDENWDDILAQYLNGELHAYIPHPIQKLLTQHAPIVEVMHRFYKSIQKDKSTPYPLNQLNLLLGIKK